jgi:hypothetical protein
MNNTRFSSADSEAQARAQIPDQVSVTGRFEGPRPEVASDTPLAVGQPLARERLARGR